jgi:hypothetical protein
MMTKSLMGLVGRKEEVTGGTGVASPGGRVQAEPTEGGMAEAGVAIGISVEMVGGDSADEAMMMMTKMTGRETDFLISRLLLILSFLTRLRTRPQMITARMANQLQQQLPKVLLTTMFPSLSEYPLRSKPNVRYVDKFAKNETNAGKSVPCEQNKLRQFGLDN